MPMVFRPYCAVRGCKNANIPFFKLPKDPELCKNWLQLMDRPDLLSKPNFKYTSYRICAAHFHESSINTIRQLKPGSIPVKNLPKADTPLDEKSTTTEDSSMEPSTSTHNNKYSVEIQTDFNSKKEENHTEKSLKDNSSVPYDDIKPKQTQESLCCLIKPLYYTRSTQTRPDFVNNLPHINKLRVQFHRCLKKHRVLEKKYKDLQSFLLKHERSGLPVRLTCSKRRKYLKPFPKVDSPDEVNEFGSSIVVDDDEMKPVPVKSPTYIIKEEPLFFGYSLNDKGPSTNTAEPPEDKEVTKKTQEPPEEEEEDSQTNEFEDYFNKWQEELLSKKKKYYIRFKDEPL